MRAGEKESRRERDTSGALGGPDEEKRGDPGDFGNPQVTVQTIGCENSKLRGLFSIPVAQRASGKNPGSSAGSGPTHTRSRPPGNLATWFLMMRLVKLLKSVFLGGLHSGEKLGRGREEAEEPTLLEPCLVSGSTLHEAQRGEERGASSHSWEPRSLSSKAFSCPPCSPVLVPADKTPEYLSAKPGPSRAAGRGRFRPTPAQTHPSKVMELAVAPKHLKPADGPQDPFHPWVSPSPRTLEQSYPRAAGCLCR